jgi:flagellar basal body-associated protein FliL
MADKAEKKPEAAPASAAAAAAPTSAGAPAPAAAHAAAGKGGVGGLLSKTPVMLGGVMILEALVLFAGFRMLGGGPQSAHGADLQLHEDEKKGDGHGEEGNGSSAPKAGTVELQVLEFRAQNKLSGRTFLYDVSVYLVTKAEFSDKVKSTLAGREALIKDRVRTIIAQNDPEKLGGGSEPGLETLRRQVKHQLDEIVGDGMIEEVLIPRCIPFRTDY